MSKPKYKKGRRIKSVADFSKTFSLWFIVTAGTRNKTLHRSFLISWQYRTLEAFINGGWVYVAEPLQAQPQEEKNKKVIHLWMDGYDCNGDHAGPSRCGVYEAATLRDAVIMWANEKPDRWKDINMDRNPPTFWGCSFFDKKR